MPFPNTLKTYNFGAVQAIVGPIPISNFGPEGAIEVEYPSDLLESVVSADGWVTYEVNEDHRVQVTLRVMETCDALPQLQVMWDLQMLAMREGRNPPDWSFYMNCRSTGDILQGRMVFMKEPSASKAKGVGTREIMIELPYARGRMLYGAGADGVEDLRTNLRSTYASTFEGI